MCRSRSFDFLELALDSDVFATVNTIDNDNNSRNEAFPPLLPGKAVAVQMWQCEDRGVSCQGKGTSRRHLTRD